MRVEHFLAMNSSEFGPVGRPSSGTVGVVCDNVDCSSGWWFIGGLVVGVAGTLATQAFGPTVAQKAKSGLKRRAMQW